MFWGQQHIFINIFIHFLWSYHEVQILVSIVKKSFFHHFGFLKVVIPVSAALHNQSHSIFCQLLLKVSGADARFSEHWGKYKQHNLFFRCYSTVHQLTVNFKTSAMMFTIPYKLITIIVITRFSWKPHTYQSSILLILKDCLLASEQWLLALIIPWNQNRLFLGSSCVTLLNIYTL